MCTYNVAFQFRYILSSNKIHTHIHKNTLLGCSWPHDFTAALSAISKTLEMVHIPAHTGQFETTVQSRSAVFHRNRMEWRDTECPDRGDSHRHCFEGKKAGNKRVPTTLLHSQKNIQNESMWSKVRIILNWVWQNIRNHRGHKRKTLDVLGFLFIGFWLRVSV